MGEDIFSNIKPEEIVLPLNILNGYADAFNKTFTDKLVFELKKKMEDDNAPDSWEGLLSTGKKEQEEKTLVIRAFIVAPGLNNYRLLVLKLKYRVSEVYPCDVESMLEEKKFNCDNSDEVKKALEDIFNSDSFQRPVKMLLSQLISQ